MRWLWLLLLLAGCGAAPEAEYNAALDELTRLEAVVDAGFDRASAHNKAIFDPSGWDDPQQLTRMLTEAETDMGRVVAAQQARIGQERAILALKLMENAPQTRTLYLLDIKAQQAKLAIFEISHEMYGKLREEAAANNRSGFDELAEIYRRGVQSAKRRFVDMDLARQQHQERMKGPEENRM